MTRHSAPGKRAWISRAKYAPYRPGMVMSARRMTEVRARRSRVIGTESAGNRRRGADRVCARNYAAEVDGGTGLPWLVEHHVPAPEPGRDEARTEWTPLARRIDSIICGAVPAPIELIEACPMRA